MKAGEDHINNVYLVRRLVKLLDQRLSGRKISGTVSTGKQELILQAGTEEAIENIKIYLGQESFIFFPDTYQSAARDKRDVLPEIEGKEVHWILEHPEDRSFRIVFEEELTLVVTLYGRNGNILLFKEDRLIRTFRPNIKRDLERSLSDFSLSQPSFKAFSELAQEERMETAVKKIFPGLTHEIRRHFQIDTDGTEAEFLWDKIMSAEEVLQDTGYYLYRPKNQKVRLSYFNPEGEILLSTADTLEALNSYARYYYHDLQFYSLREKLLAKTEEQIKLAEATVRSSRKQLQSLGHEKSYKWQADLLMANLHQIPAGAETVKVTDFYDGQEVELPIRKGYSPQKWAEKLYHKAKRQEVEKGILQERIAENEEKLLSLYQEKSEIEETHQLRELKKRTKEEEKKEKAEVSLPYKHFTFAGYDILVGRNAAGNDRLTFGYAHKEDLWLHARDVSGSHVVIKRKGQKEVPMPVVQRAAELAAWYSKGRTSGLFPVMYTQRKYVRKPKGAAPGAVICEKEKVVLVKPGTGD